MDRLELAKALTRSAAAENKAEKRTATVQVSGVATSDSAAFYTKEKGERLT